MVLFSRGSTTAAERIIHSRSATRDFSAFGTPKPTLTNSYHPELLNIRTFPTLMGYSSRIMAESWESNLLYYAALADEVHMHPSQLNIAVPEWTQQTVEKIFATHLEDWPALLRSLRLVGDDVRAKSEEAVGCRTEGFIAVDTEETGEDDSSVIRGAAAASQRWLLLYAQERPVFRVKVDMVVLGFTVTDNKGNTSTG